VLRWLCTTRSRLSWQDFLVARCSGPAASANPLRSELGFGVVSISWVRVSGNGLDERSIQIEVCCVLHEIYQFTNLNNSISLSFPPFTLPFTVTHSSPSK
jgi:hypothetical protein